LVEEFDQTTAVLYNMAVLPSCNANIPCGTS
jgi:hypothetical protein